MIKFARTEADSMTEKTNNSNYAKASFLIECREKLERSSNEEVPDITVPWLVTNNLLGGSLVFYPGNIDGLARDVSSLQSALSKKKEAEIPASHTQVKKVSVARSHQTTNSIVLLNRGRRGYPPPPEKSTKEDLETLYQIVATPNLETGYGTDLVKVILRKLYGNLSFDQIERELNMENGSSEHAYHTARIKVWEKLNLGVGKNRAINPGNLCYFPDLDPRSVRARFDNAPGRSDLGLVSTDVFEKFFGSTDQKPLFSTRKVSLATDISRNMVRNSMINCLMLIERSPRVIY